MRSLLSSPPSELPQAAIGRLPMKASMAIGLPRRCRHCDVLHGWVQLNGVLTEPSRSMGLHDFHPFVLPADGVRQPLFVRRVVRSPSELPPGWRRKG